MRLQPRLRARERNISGGKILGISSLCLLLSTYLGRRETPSLGRVRGRIVRMARRLALTERGKTPGWGGIRGETDVKARLRGRTPRGGGLRKVVG